MSFFFSVEEKLSVSIISTITPFTSFTALIQFVFTMAEAFPPYQEAEFASPKKKRIYVSLSDKVGICAEAEQVVNTEKILSFKAFCREKDVDPAQLRRWQKNILKMKQAMDSTSRKKTKLVCTTGRKSRLDRMKDLLMPWINSLRAEGKVVSVRHVAGMAKQFDNSLRRMKRHSLFQMVRRFLRSNNIVMRSPTNKSQDDPREKREAANAFLLSTRPLIHQSVRHPAFVMNMDQTPYNPKDCPTRTLALKGSRTVSVKELKTTVGRITACLTVCADGTKLPPLIVFKGIPGRAVERETKKYASGAEYTVQENAWTDERVMLYWIDKVLAPYVKKAPKGIVPYLIMDKYACHYQGSVAKAIEDLGVEWDIIPGGCTGLVQPVDIGIGKPWKNRVRYRFEDWMIELPNWDRVKPNVIRPLLAKFAVEAWNNLPSKMVYNAWRHDPYSYYPDQPSLPTTFQEEEDEEEFLSDSESEDERETRDV